MQVQELAGRSLGDPVARETYAVSVERGEQALSALREEWKQVWSESADATESQTWEWQYLYWKHVVPHCEPVVIVARDGSTRCAALAAFFVRRDRQSGLKAACFLGEHDADYHLILSRPGLPESVGVSILERLAREVGKRVSFLELSNVPAETWTGRVLLSFPNNGTPLRGPLRRWHGDTCAVPLPKTPAEYLERLGTRTRRNYEYEAKRLDREFTTELRVCTSLDDLEWALDAIEAVHRARWRTDSCYCSSADRSFHRAVARAFCEVGTYRAFVLYLNNVPAAFVAGFLVRDSLKVPHMAYDPAVPGKYSVGKILNFKVIEYCIREGYREYDLTRGSEGYKKMLGGQPHTNLHLRVYRSPLDAMIEPSARTMVSLLVKRPWLQRLRRCSRGGRDS